MPNPFHIEFLLEDGSTSESALEPTTYLEIDEMGPKGSGVNVITVPVGTTGWASQPDGTLWVEYTP